MAYWIYPALSVITGQTKIKNVDEKLQAAMDNLEDWTNGINAWDGIGLRNEMEDRVDSYLSDTSVVEW